MRPKSSSAGLTLLELAITVALIGILAIPLAGTVVEEVRASMRGDDTVAAANLARFEQELFELRGATASWCSVPRSALPASDPDRSSCPVSVSAPNPYVGMRYVVYRINAAQSATDGSSGLRRITVRVKEILQRDTSGAITALQPLATVVTYLASGVGFGT